MYRKFETKPGEGPVFFTSSSAQSLMGRPEIGDTATVKLTDQAAFTLLIEQVTENTVKGQVTATDTFHHEDNSLKVDLEEKLEVDIDALYAVHKP